jgi:hypothetical protein
MDSNVIYALVFLTGAIVGGFVVFFVMANNPNKALVLLDLARKKLDKLKGKDAAA